MNVIEIPSRLEARLAEDQALHGGVMSCLSAFEPWLRFGGLPFFPEYTDHGPRHVTEVMASSSSLIEDRAWAAVTPADAATLVLATLLHDSAMHLNEDGFLALLQSLPSEKALPMDEPWPKLWQDFLSEASRFDARRLIAIFGAPEPVHPPDPSPVKWTKRDRLLIGEFLRRHHPRIAHEIALCGLPGMGSSLLKLVSVPNHVADLAGMVARSHGLALRSYLDQLDRLDGSRWDRREFQGVHAVFLMSILRISDYLQIHSERAPKQLMQIRHLNSPVSEGEWKAHEAVLDIRNTHDDREAVFVQAAPKTVATFLKLKRLLQSIQGELDATWAVLGEVYGPVDELRKLALAIRRVRSNMDDEETFANTVPFVPCHAAFDSAGADLLKLLITPLYGDHPEIGIRELMQNALDASLEFADYLAQNPRVDVFEFVNQEPDVLITPEEKSATERYVTVSDRGIGMTVETVLNYFLKAGASFRRSDAWRRQHESKPGKSRLNRSGRFGIGVLAAFLIGDEISVTTRHISASSDGGIYFEASLDSDDIELTRCSRLVGTTIRVRIRKEEVWNKLAASRFESWDSFCLSSPKVQRLFVKTGQVSKLPQKFAFAQAAGELEPTWRRIAHPDYKDIQWQDSSSTPALICNGIVVKERFEQYNKLKDLSEWSGRSLSCPKVSVFDPDGHFPLTLQRTSLLGDQLPFHDELREDALRDLIAWILVHAPTAPVFENAESYTRLYPGLRHDYSVAPKWTMFACARNGTALADISLLLRLKPQNLLLIPFVSVQLATRDITPELVLPFTIEQSPQGRKDWFRASVSGSAWRRFGPLTDLMSHGRRILLRNEFLNELRKPRTIAREIWNNVQVEWSSGEWTLLRAGDCGTSFDFKRAAQSGDPFDCVAEWYLGEQTRPIKKSAVGRAWEEYAGSETIIPYDMEARRRTFKDTFKRLAPYIEAWEKTGKKSKSPVV